MLKEKIIFITRVRNIASECETRDLDIERLETELKAARAKIKDLEEELGRGSAASTAAAGPPGPA